MDGTNNEFHIAVVVGTEIDGTPSNNVDVILDIEGAEDRALPQAEVVSGVGFDVST